MSQEIVETNITRIEADSRMSTRRFILVKQFPGNGAIDAPGGFFHEADGVQFKDGSIALFQTSGMYDCTRIEVYRDQRHCEVMNPAWDLRWLDKPGE